MDKRLPQSHPETSIRAGETVGPDRQLTVRGIATSKTTTIRTRLGPWRQLKVHARIALSRTLVCLPLRWADRLRSAFVESTGIKRDCLARIISIARHKSIGRLGSFALADNPKVRLSAVDSRITRLLYWYGESGYEEGEVSWWRHLCHHVSSVLEIGANVGYYTVQGAAAMRQGRYVAVEAHPDATTVVRRNVVLNNLRNVEVINAAVVGVKRAETQRLALPDEEPLYAPTGAYLTTGTEGIVDRPASRAIEVAVIEMAHLYIDEDLLKLDIEGAEFEVLSSIKDQLLKSRPIIVVEVLAHTAGLRGLIHELRMANYLALAIGKDSLHLLTTAQIAAPEPLPRYGSRDIILMPAEKSDIL
jgi:FkbM family methyltransferase